ncbi:MAG: glycosyltransferase family 4 protein [Nitrospirae bacterium]|nr:glycosyltransferase family 4 protein [Nitrospirota bacterium]
MHILFLTLYFAPDAGANAVIMTELVEELSSLGHHVTVVTTFPHYAENAVDQQYKGKFIHYEEHKGVRIIRTYIYVSPKKTRFVARLLNYLSFNLLSTLAGIFSGSQDIILAPSPPLTIGVSAYIISRFKRIPYVYNVQDINPDVLIKLGVLRNLLGIAVSRWLERFIYRKAKHITVLSEGFQRNLLRKDVPPNKMTIIPNFVNVNYIRPLPHDNSFRQCFDLEKRFVVLYAGNLGHSQNVEHLLDCALLLESIEDIVFVIIGNGSRKPYLEARALESGIKNVHFIPFQPWRDVPFIYASADVSVVLLKRGIALDSVPSKVYTIMASARPVIAAVDPGSDVWVLVEQTQCGICVEPESPRALAQSIQMLYSDPSLRERLGHNGREYVVQQHTPTIVSRLYHDLFTRLTQP